MLSPATLLACLSFLAFTAAATDKVVCYYGSWSVYRKGDGLFQVEDINGRLCTHLIYAFVGLNVDGSVRILDQWNEVDLAALKRFNGLKQGAALKTLVAVGGWNEGSLTFSEVSSQASLRKNLVAGAVNIIQTYGFDGFDLDWEYPAQRGGSAADKVNFGLLVSELRQEFNKHGYLLTAAVSATASAIAISYDVPIMAKNLDFINVMAYDLHTAGDGLAGQNAPLYASSKDDSAEKKQLNVDACINAWMAAGAPANKLVMGIGVYGRTYTLSSSASNGLYAPTSGAGAAGPLVGEPGMFGYNEICLSIKQGGWTEKWDDEQKVPYMYKDSTWVGYDNPKSVAIKVEYAKNKGLAGVMIWSIETDDFRGTCGPKYPILNAINAAIGGSAPPAPPTEGPATSTTAAAPPGPPPQDGSEDVCKSVGYFRSSSVCSDYHYCLALGDGSFMKVPFQCKGGLVFDVEKCLCNYPTEVDCS